MKEDFGVQPTVRERLANVLLTLGWTEAIGVAGYYFRFRDDVYIYPGSDSLYMTSKKGDIDVDLSEADKMSGEEILETLRVRCIKSLGLS